MNAGQLRGSRAGEVPNAGRGASATAQTVSSASAWRSPTTPGTLPPSSSSGGDRGAAHRPRRDNHAVVVLSVADARPRSRPTSPHRRHGTVGSRRCRTGGERLRRAARCEVTRPRSGGSSHPRPKASRSPTGVMRSPPTVGGGQPGFGVEHVEESTRAVDLHHKVLSCPTKSGRGCQSRGASKYIAGE